MRDETKFHADRLTGIGGSDAPVILGLSPFMTPLQLWAVKTGVIESALNYDRLIGDSPQREWGRRLQPLIVQAFREITNREVFEMAEDTLVRHPKIAWLIGHLDGLQVSPRGKGIFEAKNVIVYKRSKWADEAPIEAKVQVQHYLAVTELEYGSVAGLIGGYDFRWEDFERNQRFIDGLLEKEEAFWQSVQRDIPPVAGARDVKFLNTLTPVTPKKVIHLDGSWLQLDTEYIATLDSIAAMKSAMKPLEEKRDEIEARIKQAMGDAEEAAIAGGASFTFKQVDRKGYEVKPTSFRQLHRKGDRS